jgi:uncharacterized protein YbbK (DUF523 family)
VRIISACLLGVACRYDGSHCLHPRAEELARTGGLLPLCPEQLGGLPTPRPAAEIHGGTGAEVLDGMARVIDREGRDVTDAFLRGAREVAGLCARLDVTEALLKARSPSCGVGWIRRAGDLIPGEGVTAALLKRRGVCVLAHPE